MKIRGLTWWIDRWRTSTAYSTMTLAEQGAYRNLLDEAALRHPDPLPFDDRILAKACGDAASWSKVKRTVLRQFTRTADGWRNDTLDQVLDATTKRIKRNQRYYTNNQHVAS